MGGGGGGVAACGGEGGEAVLMERMVRREFDRHGRCADPRMQS